MYDAQLPAAAVTKMRVLATQKGPYLQGRDQEPGRRVGTLLLKRCAGVAVCWSLKQHLSNKPPAGYQDGIRVSCGAAPQKLLRGSSSTLQRSAAVPGTPRMQQACGRLMPQHPAPCIRQRQPHRSGLPSVYWRKSPRKKSSTACIRRASTSDVSTLNRPRYRLML